MAVTGNAIGILKMTASADAVLGKMKIDFIRWVGATTAGHSCILKDTAGNVLFESEADGANFIDVHSLPLVVDGIDVDTMDSGTLYIYQNAEVKSD